MPEIQWFEEQLEVHQGRIFKVAFTDKLASVRSAFQKIEVFQTTAFGKMLVHDDVIMLTEKDEAHYHEMIVHPAMFTHPDPRRVLVVGGGDGGTMREVLKHSSVREAHLCEIDEEVVRVCQQHFPDLAGSFNDPRCKLFFEDGAKFIKEHRNFYDIIIVDSSDPVGPAEVLFRKDFYRSMFDALKPDGIAVTQSESIHYHETVIKELSNFCQEIYPLYRYYYALVPTYPSGIIGFSFCSKKHDPLKIPADKIKLPDGLKYYHPAIHQAAFVLPQFASSFFRKS